MIFSRFHLPQIWGVFFLLFNVVGNSFAASADTTKAPVFQIQRVYLKEITLQQPNSPAIFLETESPKVEVTMDVSEEKITADIHEVIISTTVTAKIKNKIAFVVSAKQAGIFEIRGVSSAQMPKLLGIGCPNIMYPYLRSNVAEAILHAGFPPVHLAEVNFESFYEQRKKKAANDTK